MSSSKCCHGMRGCVLLVVFSLCLVAPVTGQTYLNTDRTVYYDNDQCASDLELLLQGRYVDQDTSNQMHSSTGQGDYGYFTPIAGQLDPGQWAACLRLGPEVAHYCYEVHVDPVTEDLSAVGACVPASCSASYLNSTNPANLTSALHLPSNFAQGSLVTDCTQATYDIPWYTWAFVGLVSLLLLLVFIGSMLDIQLTHGWPLKRLNLHKNDNDDERIGGEMLRSDLYWFSSGSETENKDEKPRACGDVPLDEKHRSVWMKLILSFSLPYNFSRFVSPPGEGNMDVLNGIRVVAMAGVVLGHTYYYMYDTQPFQDIPSVIDVVSNLRFQTVSACFFAVDLFFWLSGLLVGFNFIKEFNRRGLKWYTIPMAYLHRFLRLSPTLYMGMFFYWFITPYWSKGPWWRFYQDYVFHKCENGWWWTLLYIQNFVPYMTGKYNQLCMGWSWYLADDMQYFLFAPFILLVYWKNKWAGWILTILLIIACILINSILTWYYNLQPFSVFEKLAEKADYTPAEGGNGKYIYVPPWTRYGPYLVGFICAFILLEKGMKFKVEPFLRTMLYIAGTVLVLIPGYITITDVMWGWETWQNVVYNGFARVAFSVGLSVLCMLSIVGYGGVFNWFFSLPQWVPFARLTYAAYVYHLGMLVTSYMGGRTVFAYTFQNGLYMFIGHLVNAFGLALINYFLVEKPFMNIEALLLMPKKKKKKDDKE